MNGVQNGVPNGVQNGVPNGVPNGLPAPPPDSRALVAIDLGAESCRVSLLRWRAGQPEISLVHRFPNEAIAEGGELRWPLDRILARLEEGLRLSAGIATEGIRSIAVDGWAVDCVRLDAHGRPLSQPFCYRDLRTERIQDEVHGLIPAARMRELTGIQIGRIDTVYQLFADAPEHRACPWLNLPEYVLHWLGGERVSELTNASHTQLLGLDRQWSREIFDALGLPLDAAPRLVPPGTIVGKLTGPLVSLPALRDTQLIAPACHDTASAIAGIADFSGDWAYISSGTWSLVGTLLDQPCNTPEARAANFTNLAAADGRVCFHTNVIGLWLLRQSIETWAAQGNAFELPNLIAAAEALPAPAHLLDLEDPAFVLPGDMPARFNRQFARRGLPAIDPANAPAVALLIFHSLAARYAQVFAAMERMTGHRFRYLHIVGGGSQNELLNRLTEAATGLHIKAREAESSTLGNFAVQLAALEGHGTPDSIHRWAQTLRARRS